MQTISNNPAPFESVESPMVTSHVGWNICPRIVRADGRMPTTYDVLRGLVFAVWQAVKTAVAQPWTLRYLLPHRCRAKRCDLLRVLVSSPKITERLTLLRVPNPGRWITWN